MKPVINQQNQYITEYDLTKGKLVNGKLTRSNGSSEDVLIYVPNETRIKREVPVSVKIRKLKDKLSATDYKVIKCAECQLLGEEMPYDVETLHAERQAIRDQINELEG